MFIPYKGKSCSGIGLTPTVARAAAWKEALLFVNDEEIEGASFTCSCTLSGRREGFFAEVFVIWRESDDENDT